MRDEIVGLCGISMSLDESPVFGSLRDGGTNGDCDGLSTEPSLKIRMNVPNSVTISLATVSGVVCVLEAISTEDEKSD